MRELLFERALFRAVLVQVSLEIADFCLQVGGLGQRLTPFAKPRLALRQAGLGVLEGALRALRLGLPRILLRELGVAPVQLVERSFVVGGPRTGDQTPDLVTDRGLKALLADEHRASEGSLVFKSQDLPEFLEVLTIIHSRPARVRRTLEKHAVPGERNLRDSGAPGRKIAGKSQVATIVGFELHLAAVSVVFVPRLELADEVQIAEAEQDADDSGQKRGLARFVPAHDQVELVLGELDFEPPMEGAEAVEMKPEKFHDAPSS